MVHIFYHVKDLDGLCSGSIARYYHEVVHKEKVEMHPFDYGYKIDESAFGSGDHIVFVDITPSPYEKVHELNKKHNIMVIDHHRTFIDFLEQGNESPIPGIRQEGKAACELAWEFYFGLGMPRFVELLGRYDVWDNSNQDKWENEVLPFQYGCRLKHLDPQTDQGFNCFKHWIAEYLENNQDIDGIENTISDGNIILDYQAMEDSKAIKMYSFEGKFEGKSVIAINSTRANSKLFDSVWDPNKYDMMMVFVWCQAQYYNVSLYSTKKGIICGDIAKKYGGGGHVQAAGFQAKSIMVDDAGEIQIEIHKQ